MGYTTSFYAVDLDDLRSVIGTQDAALPAALKAEFADDIADSAAWHSDRIDDGAPTLDQALTQLLHGDALDAAHGFQYGYALELLCRHFGARVDDDDIGFVAQLGLQTSLNADHRLPIALPKPEDFPSINYLTRVELPEELARLEAQTRQTRDKGLAEAQRGLLEILRAVIAGGQDLVTFTY
jgi:hypothetical protein